MNNIESLPYSTKTETIVISAYNMKSLINALNDYMLNGYKIEWIWYSKQYLFFTKYNVQLSYHNNRLLIDIGPISTKNMLK